jgi:hypothetical protein
MEKISTELKRHFKLLVIFFFIICASFSQLYAQMSSYISSVKTGDAKDKSPLTITVDLLSPDNISALSIAYRSFGQTEFQNEEMIVAGVSASITIPGNEVQPPFIEYYFIIDLKDGSKETYPVEFESGGTPLQIAVSGISEKDQEILVLSPTDGEILTDEDFLISISFFKAPSNIDISKTKVLLNGRDISSSQLLTDDLIIISSENLDEIPVGGKVLTVEVYDTEGNLYNKINRSFQVVTQQVAQKIASAWKYYGNFRAETRNESFNSASTWYNNINTEVNASDENWRLSAYAYLTSEEKNYRQPYNRYSVSVKNGDWLDLKVGDAYPRFPNLIMEGKRVRGISGSLNFGFFNLQTAFGGTVRKIDGRLLETFSASNVPLGSNIISINESKYGNPYGKVNLGTFTRSLFAVRPSFGSGENFQFGLTYLHSGDEKNSIEFGARPQENALFGTDLMFAFDNQNILITTQAAVSLVNKDITSGNLTDSQIDSLFGPGKFLDFDPGKVKDIRDIAGNLITVNQFLGPLNPQEFASLAAEAALNLNYFNNSIKASYIYRGNDYQSFGQSFLRTDVKGINLVDRIRLIDNKLFISLGYENLTDNLQNTKISTTTYQTISTSVSIFPRADFPNITLGYNRYENANEINIKDTINNKYLVDDLTNRLSVSLSYDIVTNMRHSTSLSFSTINRDDNSLVNSDASFISGTAGVTSYWTTDLSSMFQVVYSSSEISGKPYDYFTLVAGAKYRMLENKLLLSATLSPSFGDFDRQAIELLADYNVLANFYITFQARLFRFPGKSTNSIVGFTSRFNF